MSKQISVAESKRLARITRDADMQDAALQGVASKVMSIGPYDYRIVPQGEVSTLERTHRAKGSRKNMGVVLTAFERETRVVRRKVPGGNPNEQGSLKLDREQV